MSLPSFPPCPSPPASCLNHPFFFFQHTGETSEFGNDAVIDALNTIVEEGNGESEQVTGVTTANRASSKTTGESLVNGVPVGTVANSKQGSKVLRVMVWDAGVCMHAAARIVRPDESPVNAGTSSFEDWVWSKSFSAADLQPACPAIHLPAKYTGPDAAHESTHFTSKAETQIRTRKFRDAWQR